MLKQVERSGVPRIVLSWIEFLPLLDGPGCSQAPGPFSLLCAVVRLCEAALREPADIICGAAVGRDFLTLPPCCYPLLRSHLTLSLVSAQHVKGSSRIVCILQGVITAVHPVDLTFGE
jgi:hypothetical protein